MTATALLTASFLSIPGIGRATFKRILKFCEDRQISLGELWSGEWQKYLLATKTLTSKQNSHFKKWKLEWPLQKYQQFLEDHHIEVIIPSDHRYPPLLKNIDDKPEVLFCMARSQRLLEKVLTSQLPIAVVGTRRMTPYGKMAATKISTELASGGATIVSGFMYGVDLAAHQAVLDSDGQTLGVLGYGLLAFSPEDRQSRHLHKYLNQGLVLVSEFPPWTSPKAGNFPVRNRIVAGISTATVVVEAAERSGSLITANLALDYGRVVAAIPGSISSPYSDGTRELVNQGAKLISSGQELLEDLGVSMLSQVIKPLPVSNSVSDTSDKKSFPEGICQIIKESGGGLDLDTLAQNSQASVSKTLQALSDLEVAGMISRVGALWIAT